MKNIIYQVKALTNLSALELYKMLKFYQNIGFSQEGNSYLEDNIPHIKMRLKFDAYRR